MTIIAALLLALVIVLVFAPPTPQEEEAPKQSGLTPPPVKATPLLPPTPTVRLMPAEASSPTPLAPSLPQLTPTPVVGSTPSATALVPTRGRETLPLLPPPLTSRWRQVNDFLYQLQNVDLQAIGRTKYDLVVIDYSSDSTAAEQFSPAQIAKLKSSPWGEKLVLAYMSLGEAEDIRYYWRTEWELNKPSWLDSEIPERLGNYRVRYWMPEWQSLIFGLPESYLDKIIAAGFDGVYLDHINNYEHYADSLPSAPKEMAELVVGVARYARETKGLPDFGVFVQNGEGLYGFSECISAITGIAREGLYFGYAEEDQPTSPEISRHSERLLDQFVAAGRLVLVVDYTTRPEQIEKTYQRARSRGYIPLATVRDLDRLTVNPGFQPD